VRHIETLYDELIKNFNQANDGIISPMAQLHNDSGQFNILIIKKEIVNKLNVLFYYMYIFSCQYESVTTV